MRVYKDSIFPPNSSFSSSVTRDTADAFDTTPRIPSPPPAVPAKRKTASNCKASRSWKSDLSEYKARIAKLGSHGRRIMQYYSGNTPGAQIRTLKKLEEYQASHDRSPIAPLGREGPRGGESQLKWECKICSDIFPTFQKAAVHLTSGEWCLPNWHCSELLCTRIYQSRNELTRHEKSHLKEDRQEADSTNKRSVVGLKNGLKNSSLPSVNDERCSPPGMFSPSIDDLGVSPSPQLSSLFSAPILDWRGLEFHPLQGLPQHLPASHNLKVQAAIPPWALPAPPLFTCQAEVDAFFPPQSPETRISDISQPHGSSFDTYWPAQSYQCPCPQPGDLHKRVLSTRPNFLTRNMTTDFRIAPRPQHDYSPKACITLADQDLAIVHDGWCHDLDPGTVFSFANADSGSNQTPTLDSGSRPSPNRYHDYRTQFYADSLEMDTAHIGQWCA